MSCYVNKLFLRSVLDFQLLELILIHEWIIPAVAPLLLFIVIGCLYNSLSEELPKYIILLLNIRVYRNLPNVNTYEST